LGSSSRPPRELAANGAALPSSGTALGGRVGVADLAGASSPVVDAVLEGVVTLDRAAPARALRLFPGPVSEAPLKGIRKLIADRMRSSLSAHAQLTLHSSAPAARLLELRARFKASDPKLGLSSVTIGDLALFAVSRVLPRFPFMNAHMMGATVTSFEHVHLGFAVDTPRGLMVPVIRFADELSLRELSAEAKRLASACSAGTATPDELGGSTFTVTNLGAFGIESFTPVLNSPEVGILGVCSVVERPEAGRNEARMGLSLTIDHQVVDGAPAARFLQALVGAIADMDLLVVS
jgi:pyruvate dehydrogenase E2 component (dihydrolipoamide acetyltransferase)